MKRALWFVLMAIPGLMTTAASQSPAEREVAVVEWLGQHLWNDSIPSENDQLGCRQQREWMTRSASDSAIFRSALARCDEILAGRKPRDSTLVLFSNADGPEMTFVKAARIPFRISEGGGLCPWYRTDSSEVSFRLQVWALVASADSAVVNVHRSCDRQPGDPWYGRGEYFVQYSYTLRRVGGTWTILGTRVLVT